MSKRDATRRGFLGGLGVGGFAVQRAFSQGLGAPLPQGFDIARCRTPYKYGELVLSGSGEPATFDEEAVDCPFVFFHDGQFYMTYVANDGLGYQTGLASSDDLVTWERRGLMIRRDPDNPIIRYNVAMNWIVRENELRSPGRLKAFDGRYLGVYHAYPEPGYETGPAVIGLCWSEDLFHWELGDVCLRPDDGAHWERGGLYKPCLVEHKGVFYLFYNAKTSGERWVEQSGVAMSRDLKTWERFASNPIVPVGDRGSLDEGFASDPCVLIDGDVWLVFYYGLDKPANRARDLLAAGTSPFDPVKTGEILIDVGPEGTVDATYAHKPSVIDHDGSLYHFYCAVGRDGRGISVARSEPWS